MSEGLNALFRWLHVIAGVTWIGHLYFFNFVNAQVAKTYDADSRKKVVPELMPRALYFFRWGAAWTWITGILLLGIVYYMGGVLVDTDSTLSVGVATAIGLATVLVGFLVYDLLWKSPLAKNTMVANVVSIVLLAIAACGLQQVLSGRAAYIHLGAMMGTIMAANVWMRIWPSQRKIIAGVKSGQAADPAVVALAGLRSRHNTFLSIPLLFLMVSNHFPTVYGSNLGWLYATVIILVGFGLASWLYKKSATSDPAFF
ncbi:MAG TPA: urate hydroxylase PuuD [Candidatus Polarisedimenticolia bacterium]|jgi:uncharacterized membrane protein|nr:urate hydroxylase PuuD [Candidatus Polarisedimenticolia bacterium]